jgi:hypothetical protein
MAEPFFGSVSGSPIWPGIQFPGFGLFQTPVGSGSRPIGMASEGVASSTAGIPAIGQGLPSTGAMSFGGPPSTYPFAQQPYALGGGMVTIPSQGPAIGQPGAGFATGPSTPGLFTQPSGYPAFGGYEVPAGITAPALLAAVAMRRGQPLGPTNDREIEEFLYDALDLLPGTNEVEVRCEGARVTLTGMVQHKRLKRDVGEIAWALFGVNDVVNNVNIAARRRGRPAEREPETPSAAPTRKQP